MQIKRLVNDKTLYDSFLLELDGEISVLQKQLENRTELEAIYRLQGSIQTLRKLKTLREQVNHRDNQHG